MRKIKLLSRTVCISILYALLLPIVVHAIPTYQYNRCDYHRLPDVAELFNCREYWDSFSRKAMLRFEGNLIQMTIGNNVVFCNRELYTLHAPPITVDGTVYIPKELLEYIEKTCIKTRPEPDQSPHNNAPPLIAADKPVKKPPTGKTAGSGQFHKPNKKNADSIRVIVLDAGHGGKDPGALGQKGLREKTVVLAVTKKVEAILIRELKGSVKIITTRDDDTFIELKKRSEIANAAAAKYGSGVFISIHANASLNKKAHGFETYYLSETASDETARQTAMLENGNILMKEKTGGNEVQNILLDMQNEEFLQESKHIALAMQASYQKTLSKDTLCKNVKSANFSVLRNTVTMPAILTEVGFVSNLDEEKQLRNDEHLNKIARAISDCIIAFVKEYNKTDGFTDSS